MDLCFLGEHYAAMSEAALLASHICLVVSAWAVFTKEERLPAYPEYYTQYMPETYGNITTNTLLQTGCVATAVYFDANACGQKCYEHPMGSVTFFKNI